MNFNKIETLPRYLSPTVCEWYGQRGVTLKEIMKEARRHRAQYPFSYSEVDWNSFEVVHLENGEYLAIYNLFHRRKPDLNDDYQIYHLNIRTHWDQNFKLRAITEKKVTKL